MKKLLPVVLLAILLALVAFRLTSQERSAKDPIELPTPEMPSTPAVELSETEVNEGAGAAVAADVEPERRSDLTVAEPSKRRDRAAKGPGAKRTEAEEHTAIIRGRVIGHDNQPLAGALVYGGDRRLDWDWPLDAPAWKDFRQKNSTEYGLPIFTQTNKAGFFELEGLAPGQVRIAVRHEKHALYEQEGILLAPASPLILEPIELTLGLPVAGVVRDGDGRPVVGARVGVLLPERAHWTTGFQTAVPFALTNEQGIFESDVLPVGDWRIFVHAEDAPDHSQLFSHDQKHLVSLLVIELDTPRSVSGRIPNTAEDSLPGFFVHAIPANQVHTLPTETMGIEQELSNQPSFEEEGGRAIERLDALRGSMNPVPAQFQANYRKVLVSPDGRFDRLTLRYGVTYSVRALTGDEAFLIPDAYSVPKLVLAHSLEQALLTDTSEDDYLELDVRPTLVYSPRFTSGKSTAAAHDGIRVIQDARRIHPGLAIPGALAVRPTNPKAHQFEIEVDTPEFDKTTIFVPFPKEVRPDPLPLTEPLKAARTLRVRVTGPNGKAVEGARVYLAEAFGVLEPRQRTEAQTNGDGAALLRDMPDSRRNLGVSAPGLEPAFLRSPFDAKAGETLHVKLERGTSVQCKLKDSRGEPVRGTLVLRLTEDVEMADLFGWNGGSIEARFSDSSGIAQFHGLREGRHRFGFLKPGQRVLVDIEEETDLGSDQKRSEEARRLQEQSEDESQPVAPPDNLMRAFDRVELDNTHWLDIGKSNAGQVITREFGFDSTRPFVGVVTQNGKPVTDVRISYFPEGGGTRWASTRTDLLGHFEFPWLPEGRGNFILRHHKWDLPFRESHSGHGQRAGELEEIAVEANDYRLRLEWPATADRPLRNVQLLQTYDYAANWNRQFSSKSDRESRADRYASQLEVAPPPAPFAISDRAGIFSLHLPGDGQQIYWVLQAPRFSPVIGNCYVKAGASDTVLRIDDAQELRVQGLEVVRDQHDLAWIAAVPRHSKRSHWTLVRTAQVPEEGDDLSLGELRAGSYVLLAYDRDGFGRPIDVEILGKTRIWRLKSASFTVRQN